MNISDVLDINKEARRVHIANQKWWYDLHTGERLNRDKGEQLMLVVTELSEAMEGARKNLMDDKLPQYKMEHVEIIDAFIRMLDYRYGHGYRDEFCATDYKPPTLQWSLGNRLMEIVTSVACLHDYTHTAGIPIQLIDHIINVLYWYACWRGFDDKFVEIYNAKMDFNATRIDHTREHRLSEHGAKV